MNGFKFQLCFLFIVLIRISVILSQNTQNINNDNFAEILSSLENIMMTNSNTINKNKNAIDLLQKKVNDYENETLALKNNLRDNDEQINILVSNQSEHEAELNALKATVTQLEASLSEIMITIEESSCYRKCAYIVFQS